MDFFSAQDHARRRTGRLVLLFVVALLGTIAATYTAALLISNQLLSTHDARWFRPDLFVGVALFILLVSGTATLVRWSQLRVGGPAVAEQVGGRRIQPHTTTPNERRLLNVVEEMAIASGVPVPAVYLLPHEPGINAFAAGYSPADAAVAVTQGALDRLTRDELQGVIAHEFSHILNGDMRLNTRLSALIFGILALSIVGRVVLRSLRHFRSSGSSRSGKGGGGAVPIILALLLAGLALLIIGWIGHVFGKMIQAAVSRQREFLADAAAVQFTRYPEGLVGALKKLGGTASHGKFDTPNAHEVSHYCFAQNFGSAFGGLFATHPPLSERIRSLDPAWNGAFSASVIEPSEVIAVEPVSGIGFAPAAVPTARNVFAATATAVAPALASRTLISAWPEALRTAAAEPARVAALGYALCLPHAADAATLAPLLDLIATRADSTAARDAAELHEQIAALPASHRLPLLQLATPTLRLLSPEACATLLDTLNALVHADAVVTPYEFALQKILGRTLGLAARPRDALHVLAPNQVSAELSLALSAAARIAPADTAAAALAFERAAREFNGLQPPLVYLPATPLSLEQLDQALDRLALTPAPFRKRILGAFAAALAADATLNATEAELLRALAAALDCPCPEAVG
jgi:Zn-dependent protease with chaperone function